jgi:hypothetical protein
MYIMKTKTTIAFIVATMLLSSCSDTKELRRSILSIRADLGYNMTSQEYLGEKQDTILLDFISYSNMDYYSSVKGGTKFIIPLILYNMQAYRYTARLGEGSINGTYREFLTEALMAEVNSGQPLTMVSDVNGTMEGRYRMKVKVVQNETTATVRKNAHSVIWFESSFLDWQTSSAGKAETNLTLHVTLTKDDKKILDKDYSTQFDTGRMTHNDGDLYVASDNCVNDMTESLSQATRTLAEQIAFESAVTIDLDRKGQLSPIE